MTEPTRLTLDAALEIEGGEDTTQLEVRGHSQQTTPLQEWQDHSGDTLACVSGDGRLLVGDADLEVPVALLEVSRDLALPAEPPLRGLSVLGRLSGALTDAIAWVAHELQLVGSGGVSGLHTALRAALMLENSGDTTQAELRAGDFEATNRAGSSEDPVGRMTGLRSAVVSEDGSTLDEAVALEASIQQESGGAINTAYGLKIEDMPSAGEGSYAIHTGQGAVHLGDVVELAEMAAPGTPDAGLVRLYPKSDGHLYIKDDQGTEVDLTTGGSSAIAAKEDGTAVVAAADTLDFKDFNVEDLGSGDAAVYHNLPGVFDARLTLETGVPVSTTDQTAKTVVYLTPFRGNRISLYDGARWKVHALSEISIKLTDTQSGALTNSSALVTGLSDTSQMIAGMEVTGTGIPANTTISSIDSATQVTLSHNATTGGSQSLTFKVAANKNLDIFVYSNAGAPKLEMVAWTSDTARATALATQDGIYVKSGTATRRYVGSVRTTTTVGQTAVILNSSTGVPFLGIWNYYNRMSVRLIVTEPTSSWTYSSTWRPVNNNNNNRINIVIGVIEDVIDVVAIHHSTSNTDVGGRVGIAEDATNVNSCYGQGNGISVLSRPNNYNGYHYAHLKKYPLLGAHYYQWVESSHSGTPTFNGSVNNFQQGGLIMEVKA